jgi:hypothetical protein
MRIGFGVSVASSHAAGMSYLWHDPDYLRPERQLAPPAVHRMFDDMPLPAEEHELPDGVTDPFAKLEAVYDIAGAQMERGLKGAQFLHGKPATIDATLNTQDPSDRHQLHTAHHAQVVATAPLPVSKKIDPTFDAKPHQREGIGDALSIMATMGPMVAGHAVATATQGPLPMMAGQAVTMAGTVVSAAEVVAAGVAEGLKETTQVPQPRRGLRRRDDSLDR